MEDHILSFTYEQTQVSFYLPNPSDYIQSYITQAKSFYELDLLQNVKEQVPPNAIMVDVGAYIGNHTVFFGRVCKAQKIWAIEPNQDAYYILLKNLKLNGLESTVYPTNLAIGKGKGKGHLMSTIVNDGGSSIIQEDDQGNIDIVTLDSLITAGNRVDLIKIDVEGMELEVLLGADQILRRFHPLLYIEAQQPSDLHALTTHLNQYGYKPKGYFGRTPTYLFR